MLKSSSAYYTASDVEVSLSSTGAFMAPLAFGFGTNGGVLVGPTTGVTSYGLLVGLSSYESF